MGMCGYNERKLEVLSVLSTIIEGKSFTVAVMVGCAHETAAMALLSYHRQGLLSRYQLPGSRARAYSLTDRGYERLEWLQEQAREDELDLLEEEKDDDDELDLIEEEEDDEEREPYSSISSRLARYR